MEIDRKIVDQYLAADKAEKEAKKTKEKLRPKALEFFREYGSLDDCEYSTQTRTTLNEPAILKWVTDTYGADVASKMTKYALDMEAFEKAVAAGEVDIALLPLCCSSEKTIEVIKAVDKKEKK